MSVSKSDLLSHFILFSEAVDAAGHEAVLGLRNFKAYVRGAGQDRIFYPRFLEIVNGGKCYTDLLTQRTKRFIGWLPYPGKRWHAASDKLAFKRLALENGLLTPEYSVEGGTLMKNVLVKCAASSFGAQIKGPFGSTEGLDLNVEAGEYFERFVPGRILKIWYWDATPVCLELDRLPSVVGDGRSTLRQLVMERLSKPGKPRLAGEPDLRDVERFLAHHGRTMDDVLAHGQAQAVEFRYGSKLRAADDRTVVDLRGGTPNYIRADLNRIGSVAWHAIPADIRSGTAFTVDAILDDEGKVWVLEMNSNPFIHPFVYQPMLGSLLSPVHRAEGALQ